MKKNKKISINKSRNFRNKNYSKRKSNKMPNLRKHKLKNLRDGSKVLKNSVKRIHLKSL